MGKLVVIKPKVVLEMMQLFCFLGFFKHCISQHLQILNEEAIYIHTLLARVVKPSPTMEICCSFFISFVDQHDLS